MRRQCECLEVVALRDENSRLKSENAKLAGQVLRHPWVRLGTTDWCAGCGAMNYTRDGRTAITNHKPDCPVVLSERVVRGDA